MKKTHKRNRGQIETFGLAFIVILISIGFFIFVSFKSREIKSNPQKEFTDDKVPSDFVLSIIKVSVKECKEFTIEDLVIDCARDLRITCGGEVSCVALNKSIYELLNKTFYAQNAKFMFYSENLWYNNKELLNFTNLNCTSQSTRGKTGEAVITLYPAGEVFLNMNICT
jgi:hypothetical protein